MIDIHFRVKECYTKVPNNLLRVIYRLPFNGTEIRIILAVIRMTLGWNKLSKPISYGYLAREANLDIRNVKRTVKLLIQAKVISKSKDGRKNVLGINQNYVYWQLGKTKDSRETNLPPSQAVS